MVCMFNWKWKWKRKMEESVLMAWVSAIVYFGGREAKV